MKFKDGFYVIEKGTKIYRGDNRMYLGENTWERIKNRPTFFALSKEVAENEYGVTYEFITDKKYKLLALDHKETVQSLLDIIQDDNTEIKRIIELNYGGKTTRNSNLNQDLKLTKFLCENNFEGYGTKEMGTDFGGNVHAEIMICNPSNIDSPTQITVDTKKIQAIIKEYEIDRMSRRLKEERDTKIKEARNAKRSSIFRLSSSPSHIQPILFNDAEVSPPSSPHIQTKMTLFHSPPQKLFHSPVRKIIYNTPPSSHRKTHRTQKHTPNSGGGRKTRVKRRTRTRKPRK